MAEADFLSARCPSCGATSEHVPARLAGRKVRCPRCSTRFVVEAPRTPAGAPEPAPTVAEELAPPPTVAEEAAPARTITQGDALAPTAAESGALAPTRPGEPAPAESATRPGISWRPGDVVLGLYEVAGVLGEGGMGRVYRVHHRGWDLDLAVKVPLPAVLEARGGADLFEREAETWVNLGLHPHVVTCHYVRRVEGLPLVFAEYADGGSLHEAVRAGRLTSVESLLDVAIQFAWGLHHAHERGLVHRDVKPANVMLTSDGLAKVTDFGLARARPVRLKEPAAAGGHTMTVEGGGGGTPAYASPEQAAGRPLNRRSDLWSFALSLLEAFAGGRTWEFGLAAPQVLDALRRSPSEARTALPETVADLLARCFRERPDERPHDLAEVAAALRSAWEEATGRTYPRPEPKGGPGSADALNNRAVSLVDLGRSAEAAALWRQALAAEAQHVEATYNAGLTAWAEARLSDDELLRRMGDSCAAHATRGRAQQLLGRVHLALGQGGDALAAFERAAALGASDDLERDLAHARAAPEPPLRALRGLPGPVAALALAPDGHTVAAGSGAEVRLWDAGSGEHLRTLAVTDGRVRALALLPDQRFVVVAVENAPLAQWDLASGRPVRAWAHHAGFATSLAVVRGGALVVSGGSDRVVRLWDPAAGRTVREMAGHEDAVTAVAAGRTHVVSASRDGTVRIWAVEDGRCLGVLRGHEGRVLAVAIDEARARVVSAGEDGTVRDWGLRSHETVRVYRSHGQPVAGVGLSTDGTRILSGSGDRTVRAFVADGERLDSLVRLGAAVQALAVAPDGTVWAAHGTTVSALASSRLRVPSPALCRPASASEVEDRASAAQAGLDQARRSLASGDLVTALSLARRARSVPGHERSQAALAVWDDLCARLPRRALHSAWEAGRLDGHEDQVLGAAVDAAGARALTAGLDSTVRSWDLTLRRAEAALTGHDGAVTAVAYAGPGHALSAGRDGTVRLWDLTARQALAVLEGHADTVMCVDATADGARAASAAADGTIRFWDLRRKAAARVVEAHGAPVAAVRLSPDGQVLASGGWDGTARLWDAESGSALGVLEGHEANVTAVAFSGDGRLATGSADGAVRLWNARTRRLEGALRGHEGEVTGLVFTPDGRFLLSASRDRSARVWDLRRGAAVRTLSHPDLVLGLALTPVASILVTACADRCARLWHLDWEPDTSPSAAAATTTVSVARDTVRTRVRGTPEAHTTSLREDLRRAAPIAVPVLPRVARLPWRWLAAALGLLAVVVLGWALGRRPERVRLSASMARLVPRELDLIDLERFAESCSPDQYEHHLDAMRSGNPEAHDVACVAARDTPGVVSDVLEGAPLDAADPMAARRLRRNAASALAGVTGDAVAAVCERLGDARDEARDVVAMALGLMKDPAASACVRAVLAGGGPASLPAARALRQRVTRGLFPVDEAWALTTSLLGSTDADSRRAGLLLAPVFSGALAEPAVRRLLADTDPVVADAAREAHAAVEGVIQTDRAQEVSP